MSQEEFNSLFNRKKTVILIKEMEKSSEQQRQENEPSVDVDSKQSD
jgi:hypothetical protein